MSKSTSKTGSRGQASTGAGGKSQPAGLPSKQPGMPSGKGRDNNPPATPPKKR